MKLLRSAWVLVVVALMAWSYAVRAEEKKQPREVRVRGRVVFLDALGQPQSSQERVKEAQRRFGVHASDGKLYTFSPTDPRAQIFVDARVREKELQITGWLRGGNLEIIQVRSVREGRLYDLYYRCEICNITSFEPGPCWCCQEEFEFRETLAGELSEEGK